MLFHSGEFLIFFPVVVLIYFVLPNKAKNIWLLIASYFFYMCWNAKYALLLLASTVITYIGAIILDKVRSATEKGGKVWLQKTTLILAISTNLLILFYFKYVNFAFDLINKALYRAHIELSLPAFDIILPVGVSFYIFQALGYLIDVYRGDVKVEKNIFTYALFVSFFPQLVAGPIERSKNLLGQLSAEHKFDVVNVRNGLLTMLWGYFLKLVIADRCAILVDTVYESFEAYKGVELAIANMLFAIQIYCDFMGYSTIARGAAKVLGINLMDNFGQPYYAVNIKDFWRRWHISLSTWFRDYVYIPLGGSRCSKPKKWRNLIITFMVSGLWHGANLTFVVWGLIHGLYQVIEDILTPVVAKLTDRWHIDLNQFSWRAVRAVKTFILADIAWIFFRAPSLSSAWTIFTGSLKLGNMGILLGNRIYELGLDTLNMNILVIGMVVLIIASAIREKMGNAQYWLSKQNAIFRYAAYWGACILIILSLDITGKEFIYFQF